METEGNYNLRDDFYGHFSAFVMSIYGHRPGVLTNMTVPEVEAARRAPLLPTETGFVITVRTKLYNEVPHQLCFIGKMFHVFFCVL